MVIIRMSWTKTLNQLFNHKRIPSTRSQEQDEPLSHISLLSDSLLNIEQIKETFGNSDDLKTGEMYLELDANCKISFAFLEQMVDRTLFQDIMNGLTAKSAEMVEAMETGFYELPDLMKNILQTLGEVRTINDYKEVCYRILSGETVVLSIVIHKYYL